MGFVTPEQVAASADRAYARFLRKWVRGEGDDFFPYRVPAKFSIDPQNPRETIAASERLLAHSKDALGWGYTVRRKRVRSRDFGNNLVPEAIFVETLDDLLRLAKRQKEFAATRHVVETVRADLPALSGWLESKVGSLHLLADSAAGLVAVTRFFLENPWPDCFARQIPVAVDTKFVRRHEATLRQWLDLLLPASAIDVNESSFARRFGLRDDQPHRAIRVLDPALAAELELPFPELSLPVRSIARLDVSQATVFILENDLNLLTLPPVSRGFGIRGEGDAVNRLEPLKWLHRNRVLYWGDIDVEGFLILSRLRNLFPHVESIFMDSATLHEHLNLAIAGKATKPDTPTNLSGAEAEAFVECRQGNLRLEQESIPQSSVDRAFREWGLTPAGAAMGDDPAARKLGTAECWSFPVKSSID